MLGRCAAAPRALLSLALLCGPLAVRGYSSGVDSCENSPSHGSVAGAGGGFSIALTQVSTGAAVTAYTPGVQYRVAILRAGGPSFWFRGFQLGAFFGTSFNSMFDPMAGSFAASTGSRTQALCAGLTQSGGGDKTSAAGLWTAPAAGSGNVTFWSVNIITRMGSHYTASLTVAEANAAAASASGTPSPSPTASSTLSLTPTPTPTPTPSLSTGASVSATPSPSPSLVPSPSASASAAALAAVPASLPFSVALSPALTMSWSADAASNRLRVRLVSSSGGAAWAAIAFTPGAAMVPGDAVLVEPGAAAGAKVSQAALNSYSMGGVQRVSAAASTLDAPATRFALAGGGWTAEFSRPLTNAPGAYAGARNVPAAGATGLIAAWGAAGGPSTLSQHSNSNAVSLTVDLATGYSSLDDARRAMIAAHGALMAIAWAALMPLAIAFSRFGRGSGVGGADCAKALARLGLGGLAVHRRLSALAWALLVIGAGLGIAAVPAGRQLSDSHHRVGVAVLVFALPQPLLALVAAPSGWPWHRWAGYLAMVLAAANVFLGITQAGASPAWTSAYGALLAASLAAFAALEGQRRGLLCSRAALTKPAESASSSAAASSASASASSEGEDAGARREKTAAALTVVVRAPVTPRYEAAPVATARASRESGPRSHSHAHEGATTPEIATHARKGGPRA